MTYIAGEARQEMLDSLGEAIDALGDALAALGDAYEKLAVTAADRMEEELFGPVQAAYGKAKKTHSGFAERHGLPTRTFEPAKAGSPNARAKDFIEEAVQAVDEADAILAEIQDGGMPVEVGDVELRAGLAEVRELLGDTRARARGFMRTLGR